MIGGDCWMGSGGCLSHGSWPVLCVFDIGGCGRGMTFDGFIGMFGWKDVFEGGKGGLRQQE